LGIVRHGFYRTIPNDPQPKPCRGCKWDCQGYVDGGPPPPLPPEAAETGLPYELVNGVWTVVAT